MDMMELMKTRRTYRRFTQEPVPQKVLDDILLSTRYSSSAANRQPLRFIVIKDKEKVDEVFQYTTWAGQLPKELGWPKDDERPTLFIAVIENPEISAWCDTDTGIALANMTLAAWAHGVGSCIIGACNKPVLSEMFGLSEKEKLHSVVAFGYPTHKSTIVDPEEDGKLNYYVDDKVDYYVKKRKLSDTVSYY
ncbi:MAG: nitroreductase family protein [Lachnospiraceae bacterium]|nr:nitroreductase family protein [Lachnospiraceae bacterium]